MNKSVALLFKEIAEDEEFGKEILQQEEAEKIMEIAEKKGIKLTEENISEVSAILNDYENEYQEIEISDDNLEAVAGGRGFFKSVKSFARDVETVVKIVKNINLSEKDNTYNGTSSSGAKGTIPPPIPMYVANGRKNNG